MTSSQRENGFESQGETGQRFLTRLARDNDRERIFHIQKQSVLYAKPPFSQFYAEYQVVELSRTVEVRFEGLTSIILVVEDTEQKNLVVAFGCFIVNNQELRGLYVDPTVQKRGVGVLLLHEFEKIAKQLRMDCIVIESFLNAESWFFRYNYRPTNLCVHSVLNTFNMEAVRMVKFFTYPALEEDQEKEDRHNNLDQTSHPQDNPKKTKPSDEPDVPQGEMGKNEQKPVRKVRFEDDISVSEMQSAPPLTVPQAPTIRPKGYPFTDMIGDWRRRGLCYLCSAVIVTGLYSPIFHGLLSIPQFHTSILLASWEMKNPLLGSILRYAEQVNFHVFFAAIKYSLKPWFSLKVMPVTEKEEISAVGKVSYYHVVDQRKDSAWRRFGREIWADAPILFMQLPILFSTQPTLYFASFIFRIAGVVWLGWETFQVFKGQRRWSDVVFQSDVWLYNYGAPLKFQKRGRDYAPKDPYFYFLEIEGSKFKNENPNMPVKEFIEEMTLRWRQLPLKEKKVFINMAKKDREERDRQFESVDSTSLLDMKEQGLSDEL